MSDENSLFSSFALLEPTTTKSLAAIERTRAAILASEKKATTSKFPVPRWLSPRVAAAAALVLAVSLGWLAQTKNHLVMAEVIHQMTQAKSLRLVAEARVSDGAWTKAWEFLYDRERGFIERHYDKNVVARTEIDNGKHHWIYRHENDIATRGNGRNATLQVEKILNPLGTSGKFRPIPSKDEVIDGIKCRYFVATYDNHEPLTSQRISLWVDDINQLRRTTHEVRINNEWILAGRVSVEYKVDLDATAFKPNFGDDVKVVALNQLFDEMFSLDKAIHREKHSGYELAVHELKRLSDSEYFLLMSFRPTVETLRKLTLNPGESPFKLHPSTRVEHGNPPGTVQWETARPLAIAIADGVQITACLCKLTGNVDERINQARPQFILFAHSKLWGEVESISQIMINLPLPEEKTSLRKVVRSTYDLVATLEAIPMERLNLFDEQDGRVFVERESFGGGYSEIRRKHPRPSEISFEAFFKHIQTAPSRRDRRTVRVEDE